MKQFLNDIESVTWLQTTHLKQYPNLTFNSFILYGNEDCPNKVELFKKLNPTVNSKPFKTLIMDEDLCLK